VGRKITRREGRHVANFFLASELHGPEQPGGELKHIIHVQNGSRVPHLIEVTSKIAGGNAQYVCSEPDKQTWIQSLTCLGRSEQAVRAVSVIASGAGGSVQTISLRSRRETWCNWDCSRIVPVLELSL